jgi:hypothetical protein
VTRTYQGGRPTTGYQKGQKVRSPTEVKPGDLLICVDHYFKAENLVRVLRMNGDEGFYYQYASGLPHSTEMHVWDFQLFEESVEDWYFETIMVDVQYALKQIRGIDPNHARAVADRRQRAIDALERIEEALKSEVGQESMDGGPEFWKY